MYQHTGGKWLIHGTKHRKDNQLQSPELPHRIPQQRIQTWHKEVRRQQFNPLVGQGWSKFTKKIIIYKMTFTKVIFHAMNRKHLELTESWYFCIILMNHDCLKQQLGVTWDTDP